MGTEGSGASRGGGAGLHNEDAFVVEEGLGLYVVCDGASGTPAGEVAARIAATALEEFIEQAGASAEARRGLAHELVHRSMRHALAAVLAAGEVEPELSGLTTTVTMLLAQGGRGVFGHCGDSRAHLIRRHRIHQLTVDHELTKALTNGHAEDAEVDVFELEFLPGDVIVLCTDGAEEVVRDETIVRAAADHSPRLLASRIVGAAHRLRPEQDATAVVVRVRAEREPGWLELSGPSHRTAFGHTLHVGRARPR